VIRTQIQLTEHQAETLRRLAHERRVSMAALVREAVDRMIDTDDDREERWRRALSVVGKYRDKEGATDLGVNHDKYLADAYEDWRR
jgi:Arc/MetJ-type ribon-helix-helix transcriptional regulator